MNSLPLLEEERERLQFSLALVFCSSQLRLNRKWQCWDKISQILGYNFIRVL
ncbi:rCG33857, isoform CRA_e [Rattus norvegicus]|uniref:RCG33857, isoform CRA_e n=1 Tax=Rattus norvegicus TaxID=10116 RepID=A6HFN4_RAT|nr:rCG33857, isoform CRA_e [Rattus norvegicus]